MQIGVWGDSITYGECDEEALGWVGRLRADLVRTDDIELYNRGICGDTTRDLLKRFAVEAAAVEPSKVVFAIGINDSRYRQGSTQNEVPLEEFKSNLSELIVQARKHTQEIILVGATDVDETAIHSSTRFINADIGQYNEALSELAKSENLPFISMAGVLEAADLGDGLHPNAAGYAKMYERIRKNLLPV